MNSRHGNRVDYTERQEVARETLKANPHFSQAEIARRLHVSRQAVSKWTTDITEHHKMIRAIRIEILRRLGLSQRDIADELEISVGTVNGLFKNVIANIFEQLTEPLLMEAAAGGVVATVRHEAYA